MNEKNVKLQLRNSQNNRSLVNVNHKQPKISQLTAYLLEQVLSNHSNGFTFDPRRLVFPTFAPNSYVVSLFGYERKFTHSPTCTELNLWLTEHWSVIQQQGHYIGGWLDRGYYYLDISIVIVGLKEALDFARANRQKAIFDPYNGISIPAAPSIAA